MKLIIAVLLTVIALPTAQAVDNDAKYKSVKCPSADIIAKSYLEVEAGGFRAAGRCVDEKAYPFLSLGRPPSGSAEGVPTKIETASDSKPFTIDKITKNSAVHYTVAFTAHLQSGASLKDTLEFDTLQGPMKNRLGCALISVQPQHLVIRAHCKH